MKLIVIAAVVGSMTACGGGSGGSSPTAPTAAPANVAASYDATVTAASTCSANLPTEVMTLQFIANVTQTGAAIQGQLIAKVPGVPELALAGTVSGQTVNFPSFTFTQTMGRGAAFSGSGSASVAANGLTINGTLNGTYQTSSGASCTATNHQLQLVKLCLTPIANGTALLPCQS